MSANAADVQQTINALDPATQNMLIEMRQRAGQLAKQPYETYGRERAAPLPAEIARARALANQPGMTTEPFIRAAQEAAQQQRSFPTAYREYMNPYVREVVEEMGREGNENLTRNVIPALDAKFSRLGQFGSTRHQKELGQAARDIQRDIRAEQKKAMLTGYATAADIHSKEQQNALEKANMLSRLSGFAQAGRESDIKALSEAGNYERQYQQYLRDTALQDYLKQKEYDWDILNKWLAFTSGVPMPTTVTSMGIQPQQPVMNTAGSAGLIGAQMLGNLMQQTAVGGGGGLTQQQLAQIQAQNERNAQERRMEALRNAGLVRRTK